MIHTLFPTFLLQAPLASPAKTQKINRQLLLEIEDLRKQDRWGQKWSKEHYRNGYTSYGSMSRLFETSSNFDDLRKLIDLKMAEFVKHLGLQSRPVDFQMNSLWANVMKKGSYHTAHIHPLSVLSGTYYVQIPKGASPLKIEDPRMGFYMNTPALKNSVPESRKRFYSAKPKAGEVLFFESWLRHEVPALQTKEPRISLSFNYELKPGVSIA